MPPERERRSNLAMVWPFFTTTSCSPHTNIGHGPRPGCRHLNREEGGKISGGGSNLSPCDSAPIHAGRFIVHHRNSMRAAVAIEQPCGTRN